MLEIMGKQNDTQEDELTEMQEDTQGEIAKDEEQLPITVPYEKLLELCYCCGCIGHQYRECAAYKNQAKEELPYGSWTKAQTTAESMKQKKDRGRWNATPENSRDESQTLSGNPKITETPILTIAEKSGLDTRAT